ncbi:MAG: hypothetical protein A2V76_02410 [Candidatus Aminicenantes bacterium RBG_16_63_14]|nr:MAG: hypothetical protein A2V76_02410 [Candidatus Aminicenantes bacterium RBG_16_63_14]OGD29072.1 MAG: hypothetical protein A2V57_05465 [Candidatus Aminicenantes bacterium RBG_19FT_COMBO_65_30]
MLTGFIKNRVYSQFFDDVLVNGKEKDLPEYPVQGFRPAVYRAPAVAAAAVEPADESHCLP